MDKDRVKHNLLIALGKGRHNAKTGKQLVRLCDNGVKNDRHIRLAIRDLIDDGYPIASSTEAPYGFFIAETKEEVLKYAGGLRGRLIEDAIRRRNFLRASREILQPEQLKLEV